MTRINRKFSLASFTIMVFLLVSVTVTAQTDTLQSAAEEQNLEKVDGPWAETWVNPDVDITQYNKLMPGSAVFDYRDVGEARSSRRLSRQSSQQTVFGISEEDRSEFEQLVGGAFRAEIMKGKHFSLTEEADEQTILVRGALVDIISRVPPQGIGANDIYLSSVGEATLALEFVDPNTGQVLAVVAERGVIGANRGMGVLDAGAVPTNPGRVRQAIQVWATDAARKLRKVLDAALE
jgi:hypothetical protein